MTYRYTATFEGTTVKTLTRPEPDLTHALLVGPRHEPMSKRSLLTVYTKEEPALVAMRAMNRKSAVVQACIVKLQREVVR